MAIFANLQILASPVMSPLSDSMTFVAFCIASCPPPTSFAIATWKQAGPGARGGGFAMPTRTVAQLYSTETLEQEAPSTLAQNCIFVPPTGALGWFFWHRLR